MVDLTQKEGNPSHGLQEHYQSLRNINDVEELKKKSLEIVEGYLGHGISKGNLNKFKLGIAKCVTLDSAIGYISYYIVAGSGNKVIR